MFPCTCMCTHRGTPRLCVAGENWYLWVAPGVAGSLGLSAASGHSRANQVEARRHHASHSTFKGNILSPEQQKIVLGFDMLGLGIFKWGPHTDLAHFPNHHEVHQPARVLSCHAAAGVWVTNGLLIGNEQNIRVFNIKFIRTRKNNNSSVLISKNRWRDRDYSYLRNSSVDAQSKPPSQVECDVTQLRSTAESTTHQSTWTELVLSWTWHFMLSIRHQHQWDLHCSSYR